MDPDFTNRIHAWNPTLEIRSVRADPYGLNNYVLIVNEEWVCRFPRSAESWVRLREEAQVLSTIRDYVNMPIPHFDVEEAQGFVVYHLLPGRPIYRHDLLRLPAVFQDRFAADLAAFLHDLHAIPDDVLEAANLPHVARTPLWQERLDTIRETLFPHLWADQHAYVEDMFAPVLDGRLDMNFTPTLIHNDLASYHLLADLGAGHLTGVLDFGEAGRGDPAADYAAIISSYGESFLRRMATHDPTIAGHLESARFRAAYLELEWALKGVLTSDAGWYLVHLGRARDSRPFASLPDFPP